MDALILPMGDDSPDAEPHYIEGEMYNISCVAAGSPKPDVEWRWQSCFRKPCLMNNTAWVNTKDMGMFISS